MITIGAIKNISHVKKCARGTVITGDGSDNLMFVTLKGEIGVYVNYKLPGTELVSTLGSGDLFADPGLLQDKKAAYTSVALSEAIIVPIDKNAANDFFQEEPALAFEIIKELYLRLDNAGTAYKDLIIQHSDRQKHPEKKPAVTKTEISAPSTPPAASQPIKQAAPGASPDKTIETGNFKLFPENHGSYKLVLDNDDTAHLMNRTHTCPVCKGSFSALAIKPSKLVLASTDSDMRSRYKGIEPLYYEVITCPHCLFSALNDIFNTPDKSKPEILRELETIKNSIQLDQSTGKDTASVFAGYYLALHCAPFSFSKHQLITGKLLYKLSRIYQDAGDAVMENQTAEKALENYLYAYEKIGVSPIQEQQICILIGELYLKQSDMKNAIVFFSKAKASKNSSPVLKSHAESRVYDIREMAAANR